MRLSLAIGRSTRPLAFIQQRHSASSVADLRDVYTKRVEKGSLKHDERQFRLIKVLNKLSTYACEYVPPPSMRPQVGAPSPPPPLPPPPSPPPAPPPPHSDSMTAGAVEPTQPPPRLKGMYIYGHVGVGKTMAMDVFYDHCPLAAKRRVHFHKFMLEIHQRIHAYKQRLLQQYGREVHINLSSERDAIAAVAHDIADECRLLCFDEFQVTDICDAMMLAKFFGVLWERGTVLVATSNRPPTDLYKDGLNRSYFLPFIDRLQDECVVWDMGTSEDYRQGREAMNNVYYTPANTANNDRLFADFLSTGSGPNEALQTREVDVPVMMGRTVRATITARTGDEARSSARACWVDFRDLCEGDRGAADYQALCAHYKEVFLTNVPVLSVLEHDKARRFITLVDELYDSSVLLHWTADAHPEELFRDLTPSELGPDNKHLGTDHGWASAVESNRNGVDSAPQFRSTIHRNVPAGMVLRPAIGTSCVLGAVAQALPAGVDAAEDQLKLLEGELSSVQELRFAFRRAASRLVEMSSKPYVTRWLGPDAAK